jgi:hypothetical protein
MVVSYLSSYHLISYSIFVPWINIWPALTHSNVVQGLDSFLGEHVLVDMVELLGDSTVGVAMILACFLVVDEGVDLWFAGSDPLLSPRFDFMYYF